MELQPGPWTVGSLDRWYVKHLVLSPCLHGNVLLQCANESQICKIFLQHAILLDVGGIFRFPINLYLQYCCKVTLLLYIISKHCSGMFWPCWAGKQENSLSYLFKERFLNFDQFGFLTFSFPFTYLKHQLFHSIPLAGTFGAKGGLLGHRFGFQREEAGFLMETSIRFNALGTLRMAWFGDVSYQDGRWHSPDSSNPCDSVFT